MGYGDEIIGTGLARGAAARGKKIAFGDGTKISWGPWCEEMFANNPNIAPPGTEGKSNVEWVNHCKGHRLYNKLENGKWIWNYDFQVRPGEFFFNDTELGAVDQSRSLLKDAIVVEPNVPWQKSVAPNKDWGEENYRQLSKRLRERGHHVVQFMHKNSRRKLPGVTTIEVPKFRAAIALLSLAKFYIGPEGGMHHAAAAVGIPAVVLFGGFIPAEVMGYSLHVNLVGNSSKACGNIAPCPHCRSAMDSIPVDDVVEWARWGLR